MVLIDRPWGRLGLAAARIGLAAVTATGTLVLSTMPAHAVITGDCTGTGYSTPASAGKPSDVAAAKTASASGTTAKFKTDTDWNVPSYQDYLAGEGESTTGSMQSGFANVSFFGFDFPVAGGSGHGATGKGGPLSAAGLDLPAPLKGRPLASVLFASGKAVADTNPPSGQTAAKGPCSGHITIHFQDVSATGSVVGQVSLLLLLIGIIGLILTAGRKTRKSFGSRLGGAIVGAIFGFIFGVGLGVFLSQLGSLDMSSLTSLVVPIAGLVLGILIGWFGGRLRQQSRAPA